MNKELIEMLKRHFGKDIDVREFNFVFKRDNDEFSLFWRKDNDIRSN